MIEVGNFVFMTPDLEAPERRQLHLDLLLLQYLTNKTIVR